MFVEEPLAYPYSTLCLYLIVRMLVRPTRWWIAATVVAASIAPFVRGELVVIWAVLVLALVFTGWRTERVRALAARHGARATGSGFGVLLLGVGGHGQRDPRQGVGRMAHVDGSLQAPPLRPRLQCRRCTDDRPRRASRSSPASHRSGAGPASKRRRALASFAAVLLASVISFGVYTASRRRTSRRRSARTRTSAT